MGFYNPLLHGLLQKFLAAWAMDSDGGLYQALISGLPGTKTAEINHEVWELGVAARRDGEVLRAVRQEADYAKARSLTGAAPFWESFGAFLARHGHRAAT